MIYQNTINGRRVYAFTQEVMRPDGNTSNFVGGLFLGMFTVDDPPGVLCGQCLKDSTGTDRLFTVPMDAISAAFAAAAASIP